MSRHCKTISNQGARITLLVINATLFVSHHRAYLIWGVIQVLFPCFSKKNVAYQRVLFSSIYRKFVASTYPAAFSGDEKRFLAHLLID
jgi:hypothetical protein